VLNQLQNGAQTGQWFGQWFIVSYDSANKQEHNKKLLHSANQPQ